MKAEQTPAVVISSCVGGGPMERLARRLSDLGFEATVRSPETPESWRKAMTGGRWGRLRARLSAYVRTPVQAILDAVRHDDTVLVPTTNPFFLPAVLIATRALHGRAVVPLVYDLWPDALEAGGASPPAWLSALATAMNRATFAHADAVVFIGEKMAEHAHARYGTPARWVVLETGADASELDDPGLDGPPETELERWLDGKLVVSYVGNFGHVHDLDTLMAAVPAWLARRHGADEVAVVVAASGPGVAALQSAWSHLSDHVRFVSPLPDREWARLLRRSHVSIATLKDEARRTSIPSKALSAMGAGAALLAIAPRDSDLGTLVLRHGAGWQVEPGQVEDAVAALVAAVSRPDELASKRAAARKAAVAHYDIAALATRWAELLKDAAERRQPDVVYNAIKRALDLSLAAAAGVVVVPVLAGAAALVATSLGWPVLFRQDRPGLGGKAFQLRKFRTMRAPQPHETGPEHDAARLTRVGRLLRATSVDELPTFWNVVRGDMSLVGPRPLLMRYLPRYSARQARRHDVPPGITGHAQVSGRNTIGWDEKFEHDVWYVRNRSLLLDLKILARTVGKVLHRDGISQSGHATMPEFLGQGDISPGSGSPGSGSPGSGSPGSGSAEQERTAPSRVVRDNSSPTESASAHAPEAGSP